MITELPRLCEPFPLIPFAKWSDSQWLQLYSSYSQPIIIIIINKKDDDRSNDDDDVGVVDWRLEIECDCWCATYYYYIVDYELCDSDSLPVVVIPIK